MMIEKLKICLRILVHPSNLQATMSVLSQWLANSVATAVSVHRIVFYAIKHLSTVLTTHSVVELLCQGLDFLVTVEV